MADLDPAAAERHRLRQQAIARGQANAAANGHGGEPSELGEPSRPPLQFETLAQQVRDGVPPPKLICGERMYAAGMHTLAGPPDAGKTFLAWYWALTVLRDGGTVMAFDEESGREQTAEKLIAIGAEPHELTHLAYCPFPGRAWSDADLVDLADAMTTHHPDLVLWDSSSEFMALAGLDEDRAPDVTRFTSRVLKPCARRWGAAVLMIDHDSKAKAVSRYARGSSAKLAGIDVAFKVVAVKPFSRTDDGILTLTVTKDRRGWLHRDHRVVITHGSVLAFEITEETTLDDHGLPPAQAKLLAVLTMIPETQTVIMDRFAAKHGHGLAKATVSRALGALVETGHADRLEQGKGRAARWQLAAPDELPPPPDEPWQ